MTDQRAQYLRNTKKYKMDSGKKKSHIRGVFCMFRIAVFIKAAAKMELRNYSIVCLKAIL
jgi:hypothetical protein